MSANRNNNTNSVSNLLSVNFYRLTHSEKEQIKENGRQTPDLSISSPSTSNEKVYICQFNSDLYQKHDWLIRCDKRNSLFCIPCLLCGGDAAWTQIDVEICITGLTLIYLMKLTTSKIYLYILHFFSFS